MSQRCARSSMRHRCGCVEVVEVFPCSRHENDYIRPRAASEAGPLTCPVRVWANGDKDTCLLALPCPDHPWICPSCGGDPSSFCCATTEGR
jgi:hypothetical protein